MSCWRRGRVLLVAMFLAVCTVAPAAETSSEPIDIDALVKRLQAAEERIRELESRSAVEAQRPFRSAASGSPIEPAMFQSEADDLPVLEGLPLDDEEPSFRSSLDDLKDRFEKRIIKLEENYEKSKEADKKLKEAAAAKPLILWTGQVQTDFVWFGQSELNRETVGDMIDGVDFRRARLGAYGEAFEYTEYRIEFDFALAGRPTFLDNWVGWRKVPIFGNIKVGHYFEPFGLERITANRFVTFLERSMADEAFIPARNTGLSFYSSTEDGDFSWAAGVFRTFSDDFGDDASTQGDWSGTGRITWMAWDGDPEGGRRFLHLGSGYSYRAAGEETVTFRARPEIRMRAFGKSDVPFFVNTGAIPADHWQLFNWEAALVYESFSIQSEFFLVPVARNNGPSPTFQAMYAYVSYFLTGEHRPYQKLDSLFQRRNGVFDRVIPNTNFLKGPAAGGKPRGIGAWELAARWSYIDLTDKGINGGRLNDLTIGLNWYMNPYTRITANYIRPFLNNQKFGDSTADVYGLRFGFDF